MSANKLHLVEFLDISLEELETRIWRLSDPTEYADHIEICVMAIIRKVNVWIYQEHSRGCIYCVFREDVQDSEGVVKLFYINGNHYMPLIKTNMRNNYVSGTELLMLRLEESTDGVSRMVELDHVYVCRQAVSIPPNIEHSTPTIDYEALPTSRIYP